MAGIVYSRTVRIAGNEMDGPSFSSSEALSTWPSAIARRRRSRSPWAPPTRSTRRSPWRSRAGISLDGIPKPLVVSSEEIRDALSNPWASSLKCSEAGPRADAARAGRGHRGPRHRAHGGGALLRNLDKRLREETGLPLFSSPTIPLSSVCLGAARCWTTSTLLQARRRRLMSLKPSQRRSEAVLALLLLGFFVMLTMQVRRGGQSFLGNMALAAFGPLLSTYDSASPSHARGLPGLWSGSGIRPSRPRQRPPKPGAQGPNRVVALPGEGGPRLEGPYPGPQASVGGGHRRAGRSRSTAPPFSRYLLVSCRESSPSRRERRSWGRRGCGAGAGAQRRTLQGHPADRSQQRRGSGLRPVGREGRSRRQRQRHGCSLGVQRSGCPRVETSSPLPGKTAFSLPACESRRPLR